MEIFWLLQVVLQLVRTYINSFMMLILLYSCCFSCLSYYCSLLLASNVFELSDYTLTTIFQLPVFRQLCKRIVKYYSGYL
jgi:hypothetical protein